MVQVSNRVCACTHTWRVRVCVRLCCVCGRLCVREQLYLYRSKASHSYNYSHSIWSQSRWNCGGMVSQCSEARVSSMHAHKQQRRRRRCDDGGCWPCCDCGINYSVHYRVHSRLTQWPSSIVCGTPPLVLLTGTQHLCSLVRKCAHVCARVRMCDRKTIN